MQEQYSVGIYARLSRDDERAGESVSIENQKELLTRYAQEQGRTVKSYYLDAADIIGLKQNPTKWASL